MKKISSISLLVSVLFLMGATASAAVTKTAPVKYTPEQQACINKNMQPAIKVAQDALNTATRDVLKTRQEAITVAQKITDAADKKAAIKAALDEYNNNSAVKQARIPYMQAVKEARTAAIASCTPSPVNSVAGASFLQAVERFLANVFNFKK